MPALPILRVYASDLIQNGGPFFVQDGPAEAVTALATTDDYPLEGGPAQPVYVVSDAEVAAGRPVIRGGARVMKQVVAGYPAVIGGAAKPVYVAGGKFDFGKNFGWLGYQPKTHGGLFNPAIGNAGFLAASDGVSNGDGHILSLLSQAELQGQKLYLNLSNYAHGGNGRGSYSVAGTNTLFSLAKFKTQLDYYDVMTPQLLHYIATGTWAGHMLMDEAGDPSNWSSGPVVQDAVVSWADLNAAAAYSKLKWPGLPVFHSSVMSFMWGGFPWNAPANGPDGTSHAFTYVNMTGDPVRDLLIVNTLANQCGWRLVITNNYPDAHGTNAAASDADFVSAGKLFLASPQVEGYLLYRWQDNLPAAIGVASQSLLAIAQKSTAPVVINSPSTSGDWLLDTYITPVPAPFPFVPLNPGFQLAEPGPGLMCTVDTNPGGILSKSGGHLVWSGTPTSLVQVYPSCMMNRIPGMAFGVKVPVIGVMPGGTRFGAGLFHDNSGPTQQDYAVDFVNSVAMRAKSSNQAVGQFTVAAGLEVVFVQLATGALTFMRQGASGPHTLLYPHNSGVTKLWPMQWCQNGAAIQVETSNFHVSPLGAGFQNPSDYQSLPSASAVAGTVLGNPQVAADMVFEATWQAVIGQVWNLMFRRTADSDTLEVQLDQTGQTVGLKKVVTSATSDLSGAPVATTLTNGSNYRVVIYMKGNVINVSVNDVQKFSVNSGQFSGIVGAKTDRDVVSWAVWGINKTLTGM